MKKKRFRLGIRGKISLGFIILAAMLFISGALSILELTSLGKTLRIMLDDSYRSIEYSNQMQLAIAKQKYALILAVSSEGDSSQEADKLYREAHRQFLENLERARRNLTLPDEKEIVDSVAMLYKTFHTQTQSYLRERRGNVDMVLQELGTESIELMVCINHLFRLNQRSLYETASMMESSPHRAFRPGIISIVTGILFTLMFTYFVRVYYVSPLQKIIKSIMLYLKIDRYQPVTLTGNDELQDLRNAVDQLVANSQAKEKKRPAKPGR